MADPDPLLPLANCAIPIASCTPGGCDLVSVYGAQKNLCGIVEYLLQAVEALKLTLVDQDRMALLMRETADLKREILRLNQSAIVCLSWNPDTCQIQGTTITRVVKNFDKDPCVAALEERVSDIERANLNIQNINDLTNQVGELATQIGGSLSSVTVNGSGNIVSETIAGTVSSSATSAIIANVEKAVTIKQEAVVTGGAVASYDFPFTVPGTGLKVVEFDVIFKNPVTGLIYDFDIQNAALASLTQFDGLTFGCVVDKDDTNTFHRSRKALLNMTPGNYHLVINENAATNLASLQMSIQIKSLP